MVGQSAKQCEYINVINLVVDYLFIYDGNVADMSPRHVNVADFLRNKGPICRNIHGMSRHDRKFDLMVQLVRV